MLSIWTKTRIRIWIRMHLMPTKMSTKISTKMSTRMQLQTRMLHQTRMLLQTRMQLQTRTTPTMLLKMMLHHQPLVRTQKKRKMRLMMKPQPQLSKI